MGWVTSSLSPHHRRSLIVLVMTKVHKGFFDPFVDQIVRSLSEVGGPLACKLHGKYVINDFNKYIGRNFHETC